MTTIKEFLALKLAEAGYDGMFNPDGRCACLNEMLAPCGECDIEKCSVGYQVFCKPPDCVKCPNSCNINNRSLSAWRVHGEKL